MYNYIYQENAQKVLNIDHDLKEQNQKLNQDLNLRIENMEELLNLMYLMKPDIT